MNELVVDGFDGSGGLSQGRIGEPENMVVASRVTGFERRWWTRRSSGIVEAFLFLRLCYELILEAVKRVNVVTLV